MNSRKRQQYPGLPPGVIPTLGLNHAQALFYLDVANGWIDEDPDDASNFMARHYAWRNLDEPHQALADISRAIDIEPDATFFALRGELFREVGAYEDAIKDYSKVRELVPHWWAANFLDLLFEADCRARIGDEEGAMVCCEHLPDDEDIPSVKGAPSGSLASVKEQFRAIAAQARAARN